MKTKMLRASCIARGLVKKGGKKKLVQRLSASLAEQKNAGAIMVHVAVIHVTEVQQPAPIADRSMILLPSFCVCVVCQRFFGGKKRKRSTSDSSTCSAECGRLAQGTRGSSDTETWSQAERHESSKSSEGKASAKSSRYVNGCNLLLRLLF